MESKEYARALITQAFIDMEKDRFSQHGRTYMVGRIGALLCLACEFGAISPEEKQQMHNDLKWLLESL